jgi:hypothetical protein
MVSFCQYAGNVSDAFLHPNDQMEALSRAYVAAIAAKAGYAMSSPDFDRDSIDVMVFAKGAMRPQIGIQLKATTTVSPDATGFSFPLPIKTYNDLRIRTQIPRILVVLALPDDSSEWLEHQAYHLLMRRCAYWTSILGSPETANVATVSISIDISKRFDVDTLISLMQKSRDGAPL